ncbi:MAG: NnrS family protein [Pseudomonadota bacterium]
MSVLLEIQEPATTPPVVTSPPAPIPAWQASLEMGFRPLYLAGALWAALAIAVWIIAPQYITGVLQGTAWHAHEMLWGFIATIAVGFLITAAANWTGRNPIRGGPLAFLLGLWVIARAGFLVRGSIAFYTAAACELLFFLVAALALARVVAISRNARNYGLPLMLLALAATDATYLFSFHTGHHAQLMLALDAGMLCMAAIALLVARRVIPFFAMRAVAGLLIPMQTRSGQFQLGVCVAAVVSQLAGLRLPLVFFLVLAGAVSLYQVLSWKPLSVLREPLLWILYLGYAALGLGLLAAAAHALNPQIRAAVHVHIMAMGGFSVLIIGMMTRTALGHLGRPLRLDRSMQASYWLVLAAVALRLCALQAGSHNQLLLQLAATAWISAFTLYLWRFSPMMVRPPSVKTEREITQGKRITAPPLIKADSEMSKPADPSLSEK